MSDYTDDIYHSWEDTQDYRKQQKEKTMDNIVSGKISKKKVDNYAWGDKITFLVNGKWISALINKKNPPPEEMLALLRNLQEGDEAQFGVVEAPNKTDPAKPPYLNISDVSRVDRVGGDTGEPQDYKVGSPVQPAGHPKAYHQDAPDSMILSYAKDGAIALIIPGESTDDLLAQIAALYKGMKSILTGE